MTRRFDKYQAEAAASSTITLQVISLLGLIGDDIIRKRFLLYAVVMILAVAFMQPSHSGETRESKLINKPKQVQAIDPVKKINPPKEVQSIVTTQVPAATAQQSQPESTAAQPQTPVSPKSCDEAISEVWPANLQAGARLVSQKESSLNTDQIGPIRPDGSIGYNFDGSRDYGCFQINNKAHKDFFENGDWRDPVYNAQYALKIYNERENWTAWYAVKGLLW